MEINASVVYAQPSPMAEVIGLIAADAAAPSSHRNKLFAAVAAADFPGQRSTIKALRTCEVPIIDHPVMNRRIIGAARLTL
mgnify:CR=1 FL=1